MSDKFKPYRSDRRPKRFKSEPDFGGARKDVNISKQDRKQRKDNSWKRDLIR